MYKQCIVKASFIVAYVAIFFLNQNSTNDVVWWRAKLKSVCELDMSLPANPVNDRRAANAVTLKSTFCLL